MIQTVYVLELLRWGEEDTVVRGHFAQSLGAAQRAARRYGLAGRWQSGDDAVVSVLRSQSGVTLARVVKERLEYG